MRLNDWKLVEAEAGGMQQYRSRTVALLRKYFRMSVELGHLPSLFGREFFRSNVSSYSTHTFEDTAIFVLDMERILARLDRETQTVLARIFFQQYSYDEAAPLLRMSRRTLVRRVADALDACASVLLDCGLLAPAGDSVSAAAVKRGTRKAPSDEKLPPKMPPEGILHHRPYFPKYCQVGYNGKIRVTF